MSGFNLIALIGNVSESMRSFEGLVSGLGYLLGIIFIIHAISKLKEIAESPSSGGQTKLSAPMAYILMGAALLYLPSMVSVLSNTLFGSTSALEYTTYNPYNLYSAMHVIIQSAGVVWFVRGCVLLAHSSESSQSQQGVKGIGMKGLLFLISGILAMNLDATVGWLNFMMGTLMKIF